jgi:two-component system, response regulator PdtaR
MQSDIILVPSPAPPSTRSPWSGHSAPAAEGGASGTPSENSDRILIVEDDLLIASQIEAALTDAGFRIAGTASTGNEALQVAHAQSPTLVVMDIRLAGDRDGIDTALELFRSHGIRCIFASAYSDREAQQRAAPAAPLGWLQKPYTMAALTAMVRAAVSELRSRPD